MTSMGERGPFELLAKAGEFLAFGLLLLFVVGLALGYRPVILVSGSMAPAASQGSLIVVADVPANEVAVGDIIVMERGGDKLVTHRIIEVSEVEGRRFAVTKGDANPTPDPMIYEIVGSERIVSFVIPVLGSVLLPIAGSLAVGLLALGLTAVIVVNGARRSFKNETLPPIGHLPETVGSRSTNGVDA